MVSRLLFFLLFIATSKCWAQTNIGGDVIKGDTTEKINQLNEVVVTAQFIPKTVKKSIYKVKVLNSYRIKLTNATTLQQVLNTEAGFRFNNSLILGVSDFELLGMSGRNIKILLDGMPVVDRSDKRESLNQIDINTIEKIELVEGPVSVIYGTDALAGVINIISKEPKQSLLRINARLQDETVGNEYNAIFGAGSHNQHLGLSWAKSKWSALAGFSHNQFGGWNQPELTTPIDEFYKIIWWRPKAQYLANAKLGYKTNKVKVWYRIDGLNEDIDSRFGMNPRNYFGKLQTYHTMRITQQMQSNWVVSPKLSLMGVLGYTDLVRSTRSVDRNFATGVETLSTGTGEQDVARFNSGIFRGIALYKINEQILLQSGIEYNRDQAVGARISGNPIINDFAFFTLGELTLGPVSLIPGLRFIKNSGYNAQPVIPSLNTKIAITENLDWRLAYAKGFRAPALRELYYNFVDANHTIYGNPNLKAEQSDSFNSSVVVTAVQNENLSWIIDFKGFYNFIKDRIAFAQDFDNPSVTSLFNVEKYRTAGAGLEQNFAFKNLKANLSFLYVGRYNNLMLKNTDLKVPKMMWTPELAANINYGFAKIGTNISLFCKYTGIRPSYEMDFNQVPKLVKTGSINWADLMINKKINRYLNLNGGIKNIFNITQISTTSAIGEGAHVVSGQPEPISYGRSYLLGLTFSWEKTGK